MNDDDSWMKRRELRVHPTVLDLFALVGFVLLAGLFLGANPFRGETVAPMDLLAAQGAWHSSTSTGQVRHGDRSDVLDGFLPAWISAKERIRSWEAPLWSPRVAGGAPLLPLPYNGVLTVPFLFFLAVRSHALGFYLASLVKLVLAGFGTFLFLRTRLGFWPSIWGGAVFMSSGFVAAWLFWPQVSTASWVPWMLWAAASFARGGPPVFLVVLAGTSFLGLAGGFPFAWLLGAIATALFVLVSAVAGKEGPDLRAPAQGSGVIVPLAFLGLSVVASGPFLLPLFENLARVDLAYRSPGGTILGLSDMAGLAKLGASPSVEGTSFVGVAALLTALMGASVVFRGGAGPRRRLALYGVAIFVLSAAIAFGLVPPRILQSIPGFASNPWQRSILLVDFSVGVLAAVGLDRMFELIDRFFEGASPTRRLAREVSFGLGVLLAALEFDAGRALFTRFNAVAPAESFLPMPPAVRFMKARLSGLESVVADRSTLSGGTLTAFGISEWFAHAFRSNDEKALLERLVSMPFRTPTAARFGPEAIRIESEIFRPLGVRFLLVERRFLASHVHQQTAPWGDVFLSVRRPTWIHDRFRLSETTTVHGIGIRLRGPGPLPTPVKLDLLLGQGPGHETATSVLRQIQERDEWLDVELDRPIGLSAGWTSLSLRLRPLIEAPALDVVATRGASSRENRLQAGDQSLDASLVLRVLSPGPSPAVGRRWSVAFVDGEVAVLESRRETGSAVFVPDLVLPPHDLRFDNLSVATSRPEELNLEWTGGAPGWIVLPMRSYPGWSAEVDGRPQAMDRYLEVLPAVRVAGSSVVHLRYRPSSLVQGALIGGFGWLSIVIAWGILASRRRSRDATDRPSGGNSEGACQSDS